MDLGRVRVLPGRLRGAGLDPRRRAIRHQRVTSAAASANEAFGTAKEQAVGGAEYARSALNRFGSSARRGFRSRVRRLCSIASFLKKPPDETDYDCAGRDRKKNGEDVHGPFPGILSRLRYGFIFVLRARHALVAIVGNPQGKLAYTAESIQLQTEDIYLESCESVGSGHNPLTLFSIKTDRVLLSEGTVLLSKRAQPGDQASNYA